MKWLEERIQSEQNTRSESSCVTDRIIKERGEKETGGRKRGENAKQTEAARWSEGKKILPIVDFTTQRLYERERELTDTLEERKDRKVRNVYFKIYLCKSRSGRCIESKNSRLESRRDSKPAEW